MRTPRAILAALVMLGSSVAALTAQPSVTYGAASEPSLLSVSSSAVTQTTAIVEATIEPGGAVSTYRFEYGTSTAYGASLPVPDGDLGAQGPVVVTQDLSGLQPGSTYHYRVVASNALGDVAGGDQTFATPPPRPPIVSTGQASAVAQNAATLTATVDTQGFATVYELDFGADTSYGTRIFGDAGVEPGAQTFTAPLQGLAPGTTYHYRILASNAFGTAYGADQTFTTGTYPASVLAVPVTPPLLAAPLLASAANAATAKTAAVRVAAASSRHVRVARSTARAGERDTGRAGRAHERSGGLHKRRGHAAGVNTDGRGGR